MKNLSFLLLLSMALVAVSCGGKDDGGSSSSNKHFSSDPYKLNTVNCLADTQQPIILCGKTTYSIVDQNSQQVMGQAFMVAQQAGIQPIMSNGTYKYKIRVTGSLAQGGYTQPVPNSGYGQPVYVSQAVIYR